MFDYRSVAVDGRDPAVSILCPRSPLGHACATPKNNNKKWTSNMPKLPTDAVAAACCVSNSTPRLISALLMFSILPTPLWAAGFIDDSHGT